MSKPIDQVLREKREENGWTAPQTARQLGLSVLSYIQWERGQWVPGERYHDELADYLGVTIIEVRQMIDEMTKDWRHPFGPGSEA